MGLLVVGEDPYGLRDVGFLLDKKEPYGPRSRRQFHAREKPNGPTAIGSSIYLARKKPMSLGKKVPL